MTYDWSNRSPWDPLEFINGSESLTLEEKGAYSIIVCCVHENDGPIRDNSQHLADLCGCSTRKWNILREKLRDKKKIYVSEGFIDLMTQQVPGAPSILDIVEGTDEDFQTYEEGGRA